MVGILPTDPLCEYPLNPPLFLKKEGLVDSIFFIS